MTTRAGIPPRRTRPRSTTRRTIAALVVAVALGSGRAADDPPAADGGAMTLVLYDDGGPWGWLGEVYAISAGNLASHFGRWRAMPVRSYRRGDLFRADAALYIGSTYDEPVPPAFLDDVLSGRTPVLWAADNIWQLAHHTERFAEQYGFTPLVYDRRRVGAVRYKGVQLSRHRGNEASLLGLQVAEHGPARVLATGVADDGAELPWAVRSRNLLYVAENPLTYISEDDRYLAFCDLLFEVLAPRTPERHRALVRIEDVLPTDDPAHLRAIADALAAEHVPFAIAIVPMYVDPRAAYSDDGHPQVVRWTDVPETAAAIRYMMGRGGTLVMHGYTHQLGRMKLPYTGASGDDFEFWAAHVDARNRVVFDGPVPDDSARFATDRVRKGLAELERAGLGRPLVFEFPHYAGSPVDSRAIAGIFGTAYHRGLYFAGTLSGRPVTDARHLISQFFPYEVTDVYGWRLLPENLGNFAPESFNGNPPRTAADLVRNARASKVVRDGFASFFFHGYYDPRVLADIVRGIRAEGYTFVNPATLVRGRAAPEVARDAAGPTRALGRAPPIPPR